MISKMIEELNAIHKMCGFNQNQIRKIFYGFDLRYRMIMLGREEVG